MDLTKLKEKQMNPNKEAEVVEEVWEWPDVYYATTDSEQRKQDLIKAMAKGLEPEANEIRKKMWQMRYGVKPGVDQMLAALINLLYFANIVKKDQKARRRKKELKEIFDTLQLNIAEEYGQLGEELLYLEHYHMVDYYINICKKDKKYGSLLFGLGSMSTDKIKEKLAGEIWAMCYGVPAVIGTEKHYQIFRKAAVDAFAMNVPSHEKFLLYMIEHQGAHPIEQ